MEENSSISFWKVAVGVLIAAILIGLIFLIARQGKSVANEKLAGISDALSEYQDETYAMYGNMEVAGSEIRDLISRAKTKGDTVCIRVFTKAAEGSGTDYVKRATAAVTSKTIDALSTTEGLLKAGDDKSAATYINPSAVFQGSVCRNANGALIGIVFEQK